MKIKLVPITLHIQLWEYLKASTLRITAGLEGPFVLVSKGIISGKDYSTTTSCRKQVKRCYMG